MAQYSDCPFRAAFRAVLPVVLQANPGGEDCDIIDEYGFESGVEFIAARAVAEAGAAGSTGAYGAYIEIPAALARLARFVDAWEPNHTALGHGDLIAAAREALARALEPHMVEVAEEGARAARAALQPGAGPFVGASMLALAYAGPARHAFLSGFMREMPAGGFRVDPLSGALAAA